MTFPTAATITAALAVIPAIQPAMGAESCQRDALDRRYAVLAPVSLDAGAFLCPACMRAG